MWDVLIIRPSCFDLDTVIMLRLHNSIAPAPPSTLPLTPCLPPTHTVFCPHILGAARREHSLDAAAGLAMGGHRLPRCGATALADYDKGGVREGGCG